MKAKQKKETPKRSAEELITDVDEKWKYVNAKLDEIAARTATINEILLEGKGKTAYEKDN